MRRSRRGRRAGRPGRAEVKRLSLIACRGLDRGFEWTVRRRLHEQPEDHAVFPRRDVPRLDTALVVLTCMRARDVAHAVPITLAGVKPLRATAVREHRGRAADESPTVRHGRPSVAAISDLNHEHTSIVSAACSRS